MKHNVTSCYPSSLTKHIQFIQAKTSSDCIIITPQSLFSSHVMMEMKHTRAIQEISWWNFICASHLDSSLNMSFVFHVHVVVGCLWNIQMWCAGMIISGMFFQFIFYNFFTVSIIAKQLYIYLKKWFKK